MFHAHNRDQCKDAGMALVFLLLLIAQLASVPALVPAAMIVALAVMIQPKLVQPFAMLWYGFSELMGTVMSKVILSILFFVLVTPVGLVRTFGGADAMQRKQWKKGKGSVLKVRDHTYEGKELERVF